MRQIILDKKKVSTSMLINTLRYIEPRQKVLVEGFEGQDGLKDLRNYVSSTIQLLDSIPAKFFSHQVNELKLNYSILRLREK